jgi:hypothetical protein
MNVVDKRECATTETENGGEGKSFLGFEAEM